MPDLYGQQGGSWMPQYSNGNWASSWGARPSNFQPGQNAYSYFQQNPNQMQNYNGGRLGNAFKSWFGGNQQGGPTTDPRYPKQPPQITPTQTQTGTVGDYREPYAPPAVYDDTASPGTIPKGKDSQRWQNPLPSTPTRPPIDIIEPKDPISGRPLYDDPTSGGGGGGGGGGKPPSIFKTTPNNIASFRGRGWF